MEISINIQQYLSYREYELKSTIVVNLIIYFSHSRNDRHEEYIKYNSFYLYSRFLYQNSKFYKIKFYCTSENNN